MTTQATRHEIIAVGEDFTRGSKTAVARATQLVRMTGSSLLLAHAVSESAVVPIEAAPGSIAEAVMPAASAAGIAAIHAAAHLHEEKQEADLAGIDADAVVRAGSPPEALAELAQLRGAWLLVVGVHAPLERGETLFLGTTAERALRLGSTPVLIAREAVKGPYQRVLLPVDPDDPSPRALRLAARIAPDAEYDVVAFLRPSGPEEKRTPEHREAVAALLRHLCADAGLDPRLTRARTFVAEPREGILGEMRARRSDLVAMGTHARTGLARVVLGSVADYVIHGAGGVDVLVAPPER